MKQEKSRSKNSTPRSRAQEDEYSYHKRNKKNAKNSKKKKNKNKHPFIKFFLRLLLLALIALIGFLAFKAYTFKTLTTEMFNNAPSSILDGNKNVIAQIGIERNRENIDYDNIPKDLVNACVSIEDQRYFKHHGVDIKRTGGAILSYITHRGSSSFGGSTITQQLVKNLTGDNSTSISRKIKEWYYAWVLEFNFSKEEILEAYLNIIYTGPSIYGVQEASHYYFNKDVNNLSLAECAFLAGLNNSPNSYNPFTDTDRSEKISKRTKTVLKKMLELEYISEEEYNSAISEVDNGLKFSKGNIQKNTAIYSYHVDAVINEVISDLANKYHISKDFATNYFATAGTSIYSTENSEIQKTLENEFKNKQYVLKSSNGSDTSQAAMIIIDHSTGHVIACTGGLGEKTSSRSFKSFLYPNGNTKGKERHYV